MAPIGFSELLRTAASPDIGKPPPGKEQVTIPRFRRLNTSGINPVKITGHPLAFFTPIRIYANASTFKHECCIFAKTPGTSERLIDQRRGYPVDAPYQ